MEETNQVEEEFLALRRRLIANRELSQIHPQAWLHLNGLLFVIRKLIEEWGGLLDIVKREKTKAKKLSILITVHQSVHAVTTTQSRCADMHQHYAF